MIAMFSSFPSGLFALRVSTVNHPPPSSSLTPTNFMSSFTASINLLFGLPPGFLPANIFIIPPLYMSKPSQSGLSGFISKTSNMRCPSDELIPDPIHPIRPHHSQREPHHFKLPLSFLQCHSLLNHTASQVLDTFPFIHSDTLLS